MLSFTLGEGENATLIATFTVDCDAQVGDVSNIVVTAQSDLDSSRNNAFSQLVVISDVNKNCVTMSLISGFKGNVCICRKVTRSRQIAS